MSNPKYATACAVPTVMADGRRAKVRTARKGNQDR